ncbi:MAG: hypothetical protein U0894_13085 [Pirellulales bacterium]
MATSAGGGAVWLRILLLLQGVQDFDNGEHANGCDEKIKEVCANLPYSILTG